MRASLWAVMMGAVASQGGCGGSVSGERLRDSGTASDASGADDGSGEDSGVAPQVWWTLSGRLVLRDGVPAAESSALSVALLDANGGTLCTGEAPIAASAAQDVPDPLVFGWWSLQLEPWTPSCPSGAQAEPPYGDQLELGIGALHPEITATLPALDALSPAAWPHLNSAYARLDPMSPVVVFGVAGSPAAFAGMDGPWLGAPLPDGEVEIWAVYQF